MASSESILAKAFKGELTAHYKLHPCSLSFGTTSGRSKWLPAILWRAANPDKNAEQHFCTATPAPRVSARDGANDLISGENSADALLKKIKSEREASASNKKTKKNA